jgi:hypothetical protein
MTNYEFSGLSPNEREGRAWDGCKWPDRTVGLH